MHWIEKLLLPPSCQLCGSKADNEELCAECASDVVILTHHCPLCALPNEDHSVCSHCSQIPPLWQAAYSPFIYQGCIQTLMQHWKYQQSLSAQRTLCEALSAWVLQENFSPNASAIVPIPMHPSKLRKRGFNTAYALAKTIAKVTQRTLLPHALHRQFHTLAQAGLDRTARQQNLTGVFKASSQSLAGHHHVLLVDDVYTTGATLDACSKALRAAGARHIEVLTLARAVPHTAEPGESH